MGGGNKINPKDFSRSQIKFYAVLIPLCVFMGIPIVFLFNQAFKTLGELYQFPPTIIVRRPTMVNFRMLFGSRLGTVPMSRYIFNSIFVSAVTVILSLFFSLRVVTHFPRNVFASRNHCLR